MRYEIWCDGCMLDEPSPETITWALINSVESERYGDTVCIAVSPETFIRMGGLL